MKKLITLFSISLFVLMFISCNQKKEKGQDLKKNEQIKKEDERGVSASAQVEDLVANEKERTRLWKAAIDSGNRRAYNKIANAYLMGYQESALYYYSLIMANKYHYPEAYLYMNDVLTHEASTGDLVIISHDEATQNLALYYLFKARELGSIDAKESIERNLGKEKALLNSSYFLKKYDESTVKPVSPVRKTK